MATIQFIAKALIKYKFSLSLREGKFTNFLGCLFRLWLVCLRKLCFELKSVSV